MCEHHGHGGTGKEQHVSEVTNPAVLEGAQKLAVGEIKDAIQNNPLIDKFLANPGQRSHFEKLHNGQKKLQYINTIITNFYVGQISAAYQKNNIQEAQRLEKEMAAEVMAASQMIFGSTPPTKA